MLASKTKVYIIFFWGGGRGGGKIEDKPASWLYFPLIKNIYFHIEWFNFTPSPPSAPGLWAVAPGSGRIVFPIRYKYKY